MRTYENPLDSAWLIPEEQICVQVFSEPCAPEVIVSNLARIKGPLDVYCWYEGTQGLPVSGALFMKESILAPLFRAKTDANLKLYSLQGWDFKRTTARMLLFTPLGGAISRINASAVECLYSSSFFRYSKQAQRESSLYSFFNQELPKKRWLTELSVSQRKSGTKVAALFDNEASLFDCVRDLDVSSAYSLMQYVEGYYLIQKSVREALLKGQKHIEIAFVLPNDETRYYQDFPQEVRKMLELDFQGALFGVRINIVFQSFLYLDVKSRPYIDKERQAPKVRSEDVALYFDYLQQPQAFLRDSIHGLNAF